MPLCDRRGDITMDMRIAVVEDLQDPLMLGRVRCRIMGLHDPDKRILPTNDLPWSMCLNNTPSISGVGQTGCNYLCGSWVLLYPMDDAWQTTVVMGSFLGIPQSSSVSVTDISGKSVNPYAYKADEDEIYVPNAPVDQSGKEVVPVEQGGNVIPPTPDTGAQAVGPLTAGDVEKLKARIAQKESGGGVKKAGGYDVGPSAKNGFCGRYQFGTGALAAVGFMKKAIEKCGNGAMHHPENWSNPPLMQVVSLDTWKKNGPAQEYAMDTYLAQNFAYMKKNGVVRNDSDKRHVCGLLYACHNTGIGATVKWQQRGIMAADANGFTGASAYNWAKVALD